MESNMQPRDTPANPVSMNIHHRRNNVPGNPRYQQRQRQRKSTHRRQQNTSGLPSNRKVPTKSEQELTNELCDLCITRKLIEPPDGIMKRRSVMKDLESMLCQWSDSLLPQSQSHTSVTAAKELRPDSKLHPTLLSFGSYRLGVHTPDADVDCLVLAPNHVSREDFFGSWVEVLKGDKRISELHPVSGAYTPVIKFQMENIKIDLIFAKVSNSHWLTKNKTETNNATVAASDKAVDPSGKQAQEDEYLEEIHELVVDDTLLVGLDETSVRSVNGVRVAQFLLSAVGSNPARLKNFRITLRTVKEWARVHGLYSNVLGFLGGVNWAILVCWVCKRNPDALASKLLQVFFRTFASWKWPIPVVLSSQKYPPEGVNPLPVWNPRENYRDAKHLMPIITPCYPSMNSSYNVGEPQLRRIRDEFWRASKTIDSILSGTKNWDAIFDRNGFFRQHANYLQVDIVGTEEDEFRSWFGLCESRLRILIASLEAPGHGVHAYPFAKFFHQKDESNAGNENNDKKYSASFFTALRFAHGSEKADLGPLVSEFLQIVNSWEGRRKGMDLTIRLVPQKRLPSFVFGSQTDACVSVKDSTSILQSGKEMPIQKQSHAQCSDQSVKKENSGTCDSSGKKPHSPDSPSSFISPFKRARLSP